MRQQAEMDQHLSLPISALSPNRTHKDAVARRSRSCSFAINYYAGMHGDADAYALPA
jgi:hypothetical protein